MGPFKDDDDDQDSLLDQLGGEVDDFAGDQLPEDAKNAGITLEITIKPKMAGAPKPAEEDPDHDPVAHMLGMCGGGCTE